MIREKTKEYARADDKVAVREVVITFFCFLCVIAASINFLILEYYIAYSLGVIAGSMFLIKLFTIQHDCGHDSFFSSSEKNRWLGRLISIFTFLPFYAWRHEHNAHHSTVVNLDKRSVGDIFIVTSEEYLEMGRLRQALYRLYRNPFIIIFLSPVYYYFFRQRIPITLERKIFFSVIGTNVALLLFYASISLFIDFISLAFVIIPMIYFAGVLGAIIFYLEHQFENTRWFSKDTWSFEEACLSGSSCMILPAPFEWFTGYIGYHHVHHLNSRIPSYRLKECYEDIEEFRLVDKLNIRAALRSFSLRVWSKENNRLEKLSN